MEGISGDEDSQAYDEIGFGGGNSAVAGQVESEDFEGDQEDIDESEFM